VNIRALTIGLVVLGLVPRGAAGQTPAGAEPELDRVSIQAGAGPLLQTGGHNVSASLGFSPLSRLDLLVTLEQNHVPFTRDSFSNGYSLTRGGTMTAVSGEVRVSLLPPHRISPYGFAGAGGGISRPTVNEAFPNPIEHDLFVLYFGAGVRVPIRSGFSIFGDARAMMALEHDGGMMGVWPVRVGLAWRF